MGGHLRPDVLGPTLGALQPLPTLRARSGSRALPGRGLRLAASWDPYGRDSSPFSIKLVKTMKCHQKVSKRPSLVPNSQNGSKKSPLDFLRIPFSAAFSHKELMGCFGASADFIVKMTKCRQDVHGPRRGRTTPRCPAASCSWDIFLSAQRGCVIRPYLRYSQRHPIY